MINSSNIATLTTRTNGPSGSNVAVYKKKLVRGNGCLKVGNRDGVGLDGSLRPALPRLINSYHLVSVGKRVKTELPH